MSRLVCCNYLFEYLYLGGSGYWMGLVLGCNPTFWCDAYWGDVWVIWCIGVGCWPSITNSFLKAFDLICFDCAGVMGYCLLRQGAKYSFPTGFADVIEQNHRPLIWYLICNPMVSDFPVAYIRVDWFSHSHSSILLTLISWCYVSFKLTPTAFFSMIGDSLLHQFPSILFNEFYLIKSFSRTSVPFHTQNFNSHPKSSTIN